VSFLHIMGLLLWICCGTKRFFPTWKKELLYALFRNNCHDSCGTRFVKTRGKKCFGISNLPLGFSVTFREGKKETKEREKTFFGHFGWPPFFGVVVSLLLTFWLVPFGVNPLPISSSTCRSRCCRAAHSR
jgi:hypothetical protein